MKTSCLCLLLIICTVYVCVSVQPFSENSLKFYLGITIFHNENFDIYYYSYNDSNTHILSLRSMDLKHITYFV